MSFQRKPAMASQNVSCFLRLSQVRQHEVLLYMIPGLALAEPSGPLCLTFALGWLENLIIIWRKVFFLLIGWDPTTWPAIKCLQITVCSCATSANCVNETTLFFFLWSLLHGNGSFQKKVIKKQAWWLNDETILSNLVIAKYHDSSVSRRFIICQSRIIYLLTTDKTQYFAQPHPITINYFHTNHLLGTLDFRGSEGSL